MELLDYVKALKTTQDSHTTDLSANVIRKDKEDSTPFNLSVAASKTMSNAVVKSELIGGLSRPYRLFANVGTADVGATVRTNQDPKIYDGLGLGQSYKMTRIEISAVTTSPVASTIVIKNNGTQVYTQTILLADLPATGKVVDVLGFASSRPALVILPALLTVTCSSGRYDIFIDGVLV